MSQSASREPAVRVYREAKLGEAVRAESQLTGGTVKLTKAESVNGRDLPPLRFEEDRVDR